jgi:hypothetical protein
MHKVSWLAIPITILSMVLLFILVLIFLLGGYVREFKQYINSAMIKSCSSDPDETIPSIKPFDSNFSYSKDNSYSFMLICKGISLWSGCDRNLPSIPDFLLDSAYQGNDFNANKYRNFCALYTNQSTNTILIFFSGTRYITEWYDNFNFQQSSTTFLNNSAALIHTGFNTIYSSFRDALINRIYNLLKVNPNQTIVCSGHSLGGALATVCYADIFINNLTSNVTLYSFASPRVGNIDFVNIVNKKGNSYRIVNTEDIVPILILPIMGRNIIYEHIGNEVPFTLNLGDYDPNHTDAYTLYLESQLPVIYTLEDLKRRF